MKLQEPNHGVPSPDFQSSSVCHIVGHGIESGKSDRFMVNEDDGGMVVSYTLRDLGDGKQKQLISETGHIKLRALGIDQDMSFTYRLDLGDKQIPVTAKVESSTTDDGQLCYILSLSINTLMVHYNSWHTQKECAELEAKGQVKSFIFPDCEYDSEEEMETIYDALGEAMTAYWEAEGLAVCEVRFPFRRSRK